MSPWRSLQRSNWLIIASIAVCAALVGVLAYVVVDAQSARSDSVQRAEAQASQAIDSRAASSRRIDLLQAQIEALRARLERQATEAGQLREQIAALSEQVRQLGGRPVVPRP